MTSQPYSVHHRMSRSTAVGAAEPEPSGTVLNIQRFSIHDGPGIRTTVFLKGCPLSCWWCHNPESQAFAREMVLRPERCIGCRACVAACPKGVALPADEGPAPEPALCEGCDRCVAACPSEAREFAGREMAVSEVMAEVERDGVFYEDSGGGVTFSGGEPLAQPEFLLALLEASRREYLHTVVDTCGFASPEIVQAAAELTSLFLYDLKLMDDARHQKYTGVSNAPILDNLRRLVASGHTVQVRVPVIPGVNDDTENVAAMGRFLAPLAAPPPVELLAYHRTGMDKYKRLGREYRMPDTAAPSRERLAEIGDVLRSFGLTVLTGE